MPFISSHMTGLARGADHADFQNRLRNVLSVVRTLVRRTRETSGNLESFCAHLEGRLDAYARLVSDLGAENGKGISLAYIVAETLGTCDAREGNRLEIHGPDVRLLGKAAESLGLAIHELATNALEHGALAQGGAISVSWTVDDALHFVWKEDVRRPWKLGPDGFGFQLLKRGLPFDLNARVQNYFAGQHLIWAIDIPKSDGWSVAAETA
jgi:two-component system CheB/CheR fusion protein